MLIPTSYRLVETSAALEAEGVEGYFDAKDVPGYREGMLDEHPLSHTAYHNPNPNVIGTIFKGMPPVFSFEVLFFFQLDRFSVS